VMLSAHHFVLYSKEVIDHLQEEAEKVDEAARRAVRSTSDEFVGVEAVS
jgi:hypothetical protein